MNQLESRLPRWDLSDFYASIEDPKIIEDLDLLKALISEFKQRYESKIVPDFPLTGDILLSAIEELEVIEESLGKLISFAFLTYATQQDNPEIIKFFQKIQEQATTLSSDLIFFTLNLNTLSQDLLDRCYEGHPPLKRFQPWIQAIRLYKDHQLSPELEKILHEKTVTGRNAWVRLYDETLAHLRFQFRGEMVAISDILNKLSDKEAEVRTDAARSFGEGLTKVLPILTLITNTLAKDKEIEDTWRGYSHPVASRNLANQVEDAVVEALASAVKSAYPHLSHRYYQLKAQWFGQEQINYWDRNAPLPEAEDQLISWDEAKTIVSTAYHDFSPQLAQLGQKFFDNSWIDVPSHAGKQSGAFSHPTVPGVHPYIMLNYHGKLRDVMTLAHELGHGVHQVLAAEQGYFLSNTPLTLAETASVFGEMLTFQALLKRSANSSQRKALLAAKVEDMLNTVVRQIAFFDFEKQVHAQRKISELSSEELGQIWLNTQREALGPAVKLDPIVSSYWSYISHFIHAPFYVYAYAFGDCLVNSLYAVYQKGHPDFATKYLEMLRAGGSKRYPELLTPFGLDAKNPEFWMGGLQVIMNLIDELETLD